MKSRDSEYRVCIRCVMDTTDSAIEFANDGTCSHCRLALKQLDQNKLRLTKNPNLFEEMISGIKQMRNNEEFQAVIGVSGGIDSSYLLHILGQLDIRLLAVHVDAGWNSIEAVKNINQIVSTLNVPLETVVIDWREVKSLQLAFLKSGVTNQDVPQDHAFFSSLYRLAEEYRIPYIISGSNFATESILPKSWGQHAMDGKQILDIFQQYGEGNLEHFPVTFLRSHYLKAYVFKRYKVLAPLNLLTYTRKEALRVLSSEYG